MRLGRALFCFGFLGLAACDHEEVRFCKAWIASAHDDHSLSWQDVSIKDQPLTALEAQQTVFPNYDPHAHFKRRPDNIPSILYALEILPADLRTISINYRYQPKKAWPDDLADGPIEERKTCRFLRLSDRPHDVSHAALVKFSMESALDGKETRCCIKVNENVR
jgi:hypothetical protein